MATKGQKERRGSFVWERGYVRKTTGSSLEPVAADPALGHSRAPQDPTDPIQRARQVYANAANWRQFVKFVGKPGKES